MDMRSEAFIALILTSILPWKDELTGYWRHRASIPTWRYHASQLHLAPAQSEKTPPAFISPLNASVSGIARGAAVLQALQMSAAGDCAGAAPPEGSFRRS